MVLLPSIASFNTADLFTKPISRHRYTQLFIDIGVDPTSPFAASAVSTATVDPASTVVAFAPIPTTPASDSVPTLHPNLGLVVDTGASIALTPFASDFALEVFALEVTPAPYGLFRSVSASVASVASSFKVSSPLDPYTLITGEDVSADPFDLSSTDSDFHSDSGPSYLQAFTLFHLIPIWIYYLLHFAVNLED